MAMRKLKLQVQMTVDGFVSPEYVFARRMVDTPKIVFSKTLTRFEGKNVRVEGGDLKPLRFVSSTAYSSGVIVNTYQPVS